MKNIILLIMLIALPEFILLSQEIQTKNYHGFILSGDKIKLEEFRKKYYENIKLNNEDIENAEKILFEYMKVNNSSIFSKLIKYKRQYLGITSQGKKIVYINLFIPQNNNYKEKWDKSILNTHDGGDNYFSIKIEINSKFCFDIMINGES